MSNQIKAEIISNLKRSKFYSRLKRFNTVFIYITGSHSMNVNNEYSDFDIAVVVDDERFSQIEKGKYSEYLVTKDGKKVHWYYHNYNSLLNSDTNELGIQLMFVPYIKNENIIEIFDYEKYQKLIDHKDELFLKGAKILYRINRDFILKVTGNYNELKESKEKMLYRLCLIEMVLSGKKIDMNFIKRIKSRLYENEATDNDIGYCSVLLRDFRDRFEKDYIEEEL